MKKARILYSIWLVALAILLIACSLEHRPFQFLSTVRTTGFLLFIMMDVLCILMLVTGHVPFFGLDNNTKEESKKIQRSARIRSAIRQLAAFFIATGLYYVYCFPLDERIATTSILDSLVSGGLLCAAVVFGSPKQQ